MKLKDTLKLINNKSSRNRFILSPMDTLMANEGFATDFHIQHYGARAFGGVGTIIVESTAVSSEGRIRQKDLGLYKDEHIEPMKRVVDQAHLAGSIIGVQLNHAGAKAEVSGVQTFGTTHYFDSYLEKEDYRLIKEDDLKVVEQNFVDAAKRAKEAGFDFIEIHAAHGYLLNQLMHPVLDEVFLEKDVLLKSKTLINILERITTEIKIPIGIRFSFDDHDPKGVTTSYYEPLIKKIDEYISYYNVSSGETISSMRTEDIIEQAGTKLFRIPIAKEVMKLTKKPLIMAGNISTKDDAEEVIDAGVSGVSIGRELIFNPNLIINSMIDVKDLDEKKYHWNKNLWYSPKKYLSLMKKLNLK